MPWRLGRSSTKKRVWVGWLGRRALPVLDLQVLAEAGRVRNR